MTILKLSVALIGILSLAAACSDSSPMMTGPSPMVTSSSPVVTAAPTVSGARVLVNGVAVRGRVSQGSGEPALFRVQVRAPGGLSTIRRVVMQYAQPGWNHHGGPMRGGFNGTAFCYDDGTHGDDVADDGIYYYMDPRDQIGCHGLNAPPGDYHYEFWCEDIYGQRSNTTSVTIVRE